MKKTGRRLLSLILALSMLLGYVPAMTTRVEAATNLAGGFEGQDADVFSALGFDTGEIPEGYDAETTDNPYGRDKLTGNQVFELLASSVNGTQTYGVDNNNIDLSGISGIPSGGSAPGLKMMAVAAGDFDGDGLPGEAVYVGFNELKYAGKMDYNPTDPGDSPLLMQVYNGKTASFSDQKQLCTTSPWDTTPDKMYSGVYNAKAEQTAYDFYWQNLLQVTTGDFDGDGTSEIAVYVPENGNARVDIYKYQRTSQSGETDWMDMSNWSRVWSHVLSNETNHVPNMVSLCAGDFNRDGVDDLAIASGSLIHAFSAYASSVKSSAFILWGDRSRMLQDSDPLDLNEEELGEQVRVSLTYGDLDGDGVKNLIATGQPVSDVLGLSGEQNQQSNTCRTVLLYLYDEALGMTISYSTTVKPVDGKWATISVNGTEQTVWQSGNGFDAYYYSFPYMRTNAAVMRPSCYDSTCLYLDSCLYEYKEGSLSLKCDLTEEKYDGENTLGNSGKWGASVGSAVPFAEYGAVSGEVGGDGTDILAVSFYAEYSVKNKKDYAEKHWSTYNILYGGGGKLCSTFVRQNESSSISDELQPTVFAMVDVDMDTVLIEYSGIHYLTYSDPKVLAIIAAAPYFEDVDIISDYDYAWQNTTSYSQIKGKGDSDLVSVDFSVGGYATTENTVGGGKVEMETSLSYTLEWEKETTRSTEYELSFETSQDEDAVAFFSIPTENYVYYIYTPDGNGGYTRTMDTISNTFTPCYQVLTLDYYESIQGNYDELPQISGTALTSTPGDPGSYPGSTSGYDVIAQWNDYPAGVSFGNGAITQTITVTEEESETYNMGAEWEFKLGGGGEVQSDIFQTDIDVTGGVQWSLNPAGGWATINLTGTSFSGTVTNMPTDFQDYGYYYTWKLFAYNYKFDDGTSIPVVSYVVGDVSQPPELPDDFQQDFAASTSDSNVLTWTYDGNVTAFHIYKYFDFPEGGGLEEIAVIEPGDSTHYTLKYDGDGKPYKEFFYVDEGLTPYTEYQYAIQVERLSPVPPLSAPSGLLTVRTKAAEGYPTLSLAESDGKNDGQTLVYPDKNSYLTVDVRGPDGESSANYYTTVQFQWQKLEKGAWTDLSNETGMTLTFANAGVDSAGQYRCRVNVQTRDTATYITAYTDSVTLTHSKRSAYIEEDSVRVSDVNGGGIELYARVVNAHGDSAAVPTGTVTFNLTSTSTGMTYQYFVELDASGAATRVLETENGGLPQGMYSVYVYYSGSYTFKSCSAACMYLSQMASGYTLDLPASMTYGDGAELVFQQVSKQDGLTTTRQEQAASAQLYYADILSQGSSGTQLTFTNGSAGVSKGTTYWFADSEGIRWSFKASRTGTVTVNNGYVVYGSVDGKLSYTNQGGVYALAESTPAGNFLAKLTATSGELVYACFTVSARPVTLQLPTQKGTEGTDVAKPRLGELAVASGSWASCDLTDGALNSSIANVTADTKYYNTAGKEFTNTTVDDLCGSYTIRCSTTLTNYDLKFLDGSLAILGASHNVTLGARAFEGQPVGTLYVISPDYGSTRSSASAADKVVQKHQTGTRLVFTAVPDSGYEVYDWYINGVAQNSQATSLAYVLLNEDTKVEVQFSIKKNTLTFDTAGDLNGGSLTCDDASITSGSVVLANSRFVFTAEAVEGYHFKEWRYTEQGQGTIYDSTDAGQMRSTYELYMPTTSCSVYAVFERDFYTLTYHDENGNDGLTAWYMGSGSSDSTAGQQKLTLDSGEQVKGGTTITVGLRPGCNWDREYRFVSTGTQGVADYDAGTYTFTIDQNTDISGYTLREEYDLTLGFDVTKADGTQAPCNLQLLYTISGEEYTLDYDPDSPSHVISHISGGTTVSAQIIWPEYYDLLGWTSDETIVTATETKDPLATRLGAAGSVTAGSSYYYTLEGKTYYFTAPVTGTASYAGTTVTVYASGTVYAIAELSGDAHVTVHLREKALHSVTLNDISGKGEYTVELPEGAWAEGNVVTVHHLDDLMVMVTPRQGYTVSYWEITPTGSVPLRYRASSVKYSIPTIDQDFTFQPVFSSTTYNTISWPTISLSQNGIMLTPLEGYLSSVASGKDFQFTLSGGGLKMLDAVLVNGQELAPDADGVYTISNITENKVITLRLKTVGLSVNGTDIGAFSGSGWSYDVNNQVLTISRGNLTLRGTVDTTVAPELRIQVTEEAASLILQNVALTSASTQNLLTTNHPDMTITLVGSNVITGNAQSASGKIICSDGDLTVRGSGQLEVNNSLSHATSVYVRGALELLGNPTISCKGSTQSPMVMATGRLTVGLSTAANSDPAMRVYNAHTTGMGLWAPMVEVESGELAVDAQLAALVCYQIRSAGGIMELQAGPKGRVAWNISGNSSSIDSWDVWYAKGYMLRSRKTSGDGIVTTTTLKKDYCKSNSDFLVGTETVKDGWNINVVTRNYDAYNYVRLSPISDASDQVTLEVNMMNVREISRSNTYTYALDSYSASENEPFYLCIDSGSTTLKPVSQASLTRPGYYMEKPSFEYIVAEGNPAQGSDNLELVVKHIVWEQKDNAYYLGTVEETRQAIEPWLADYTLKGGSEATYDGKRGMVTATSENVYLLTLENLCYTALTVSDCSVRLVGENTLISTIGAALTVEEGKTLTLYHDLDTYGDLTLCSSGTKLAALWADSVWLQNQICLTLLSDNGVSALNGATQGTDCQSVSYNSYYSGATSSIYGQGWLQDNGSSAATAVTEVALKLTGLGSYVRFYRTTTDAWSEPGTLSHDKSSDSDLELRLVAPAAMGVVHGFGDPVESSKEAAGKLVLIASDGTTTTLTKQIETVPGDYGYTSVDNDERITLKADWLNTLQVGIYTLRVFFWDDDSSDATTYTLDVPLTITQSAVATGDLSLTPNGMLYASRGSTITFTAQPTGTVPAVYEWLLDGEVIEGMEAQTWSLTIGEGNQIGSVLNVTVKSYADEAGTRLLGSANATITVAAYASDLTVTCEGETPSGDGSYTLYHNTGDGTARSWSFRALVTLDDGTTGEDVTWTLWGGTRAATSVSEDGVVTIHPNEMGTNGVLKLTASYQNMDGSVKETTVVLHLSTDAFVSFDDTAAEQGRITSAVYGVSQTAIPAQGQWIPMGNQVVITAEPAQDCAVKTWYVNGRSVMDDAEYTIGDNTLTFTTEKMTRYVVTADFVNLNKFAVTYQAGSFGTLTAYSGDDELRSGDQVIKGSDVVFVANPDSDCLVDYWTVDGVVYQETEGVNFSGCSLTIRDVDAAHDVTVHFIGKEITLSFLAAPTDGEAPEGTLSLLVNGQKVQTEPEIQADLSVLHTVRVRAMDDIVIMASPNPGYLVSDWYTLCDGVYEKVPGSAGKASFALTDIRTDLSVKTGFVQTPERAVTVYVNSFENGSGCVSSGLNTVPMSSSGTISVAQYESLTLLAVPDAQCYLYDWTVEGTTDYTIDGNSLTLNSVVDDNVVVKARFRRVRYDVTLEVQGSGSLEAQYSLTIGTDTITGALAAGQTTTVPGYATLNLAVKPDVGFILRDLSVNGQSVQPVWDDALSRYSYTVDAITENTTVTALFTEAAQLLTVTAPETFTEVIDDTTEPVTTCNIGSVTIDYVPDGISGDADTSDRVVEIVPGGGARLTFLPEAGYRVSLEALLGAVEAVLAQQESEAVCTLKIQGENVLVTVSNVDKALDFTEMDSPFVKQEEAAAMYTIHLEDVTGGTLTVLTRGAQITDGAVVPEGTVLTITASPEQHHKVTELKANDTDLAHQQTDGAWTAELTVTEDVTLSARFAASEYPVTIQSFGTGSGSVTINGQTYPDGTYELEADSILDIQVTAEDGSRLETLQITGGDQEDTTWRLSSAMTICAVFQKTQCVVTYNAPVHGTLTVLDGQGQTVQSGDSVPVGTTLIISAVPDAHYKLETLTVGGTAYTSGGVDYIVSAAKDNRIDCSFTVAEVPVTWSGENGTIQVRTMPEGGTVVQGQYVPVDSTLKITATPAPDYELKNLTVSGAQPQTDGLYTVGRQPVEIEGVFAYVGSAPVTPTEPTEPSEPVKPTEPVEPSDPVEPTVPSDPGNEFSVMIDVTGAGSVQVSGDGKTISNGDTVKMGTRITITAQPSDGTMLKELLVNGVEFTNGSEYRVYANTKITASFGIATDELPYYLDAKGNRVFLGFADDVDGDGFWSDDEYIAPKGVQILFGENDRSFEDISGHWAEENISFVADREIFMGMTDTLFDPEGDMTRAMFVTVIGRLYERSYGTVYTDEVHDFDDLDYSSYYGKYVDWASENGIVQGFGNRTFGPDELITREQMAMMLYRFAKLLGKAPGSLDVALTYTDSASISQWARAGALYCQTEGLIQGMGAGRFAPQETATRAQMATIIGRFISIILR